MANAKIHQRGPFQRIELPAANGSIKPGMLVQENSSGQAAVHSTTGGFAELLIVQEQALVGDTKDDAYTSGDPVQINVCARGCLTLALCKEGFNYTKGLHLQSAGDGTFKPVTGSQKQDLLVVTEANNLSDSSEVAPELIQCRVM